MNLIEVRPGVLKLETDIDYSDEEVICNPASFLYFDNIEFVTIQQFTDYIKDLLLNNNRQNYLSVDSQIDVDGGIDAASAISFDTTTTKITLNIPQRSGIIETEREYILISIYKLGYNTIFQQPIQTFKQLIFYITVYF